MKMHSQIEHGVKVGLWHCANNSLQLINFSLQVLVRNVRVTFVQQAYELVWYERRFKLLQEFLHNRARQIWFRI